MNQNETKPPKTNPAPVPLAELEASLAALMAEDDALEASLRARNAWETQAPARPVWRK